MDEGQSNIAALRNAGWGIKTPLPEAYEDVIESLSDTELQVLIDVTTRLEAAESQTAPEAGPYRAYFVAF
jgi:predicted Fe-Mo cluster-binding NifX family protein